MFPPLFRHLVASPSAPSPKPASSRHADRTSAVEGPRGLVGVALLAAALLAAPPALANKKVFRCEVGGRVIFQQSACGTDAVAAAPKAAAPAPNSAASAAAAPRPAASAAAAAKTPASPATPAPPKPAAQPKRP